MAWLRLCLFAMMWCAVRGAMADGVALAPEEARWLAEHPVIVVGAYQEGFAPFDSVIDGRVQGMGPDYLAKLAQTLGIRVTYQVFPDWPSLLKAVRGVNEVTGNAERPLWPTMETLSTMRMPISRTMSSPSTLALRSTLR